MKVQLTRGLQKRLRKRFEKYDLQVGILEDGPHRKPAKDENGAPVLSTYAGGPVRKKSAVVGSQISDVSENFRKVSGVNYLEAPFKKESPARTIFEKTFMRFVLGKTEKKRVENAMQAVVRNPVLRGDYGPNSRFTQLMKGFDRYGIDTGQFFKAIKAAVRLKRGR